MMGGNRTHVEPRALQFMKPISAQPVKVGTDALGMAQFRDNEGKVTSPAGADEWHCIGKMLP